MAYSERFFHQYCDSHGAVCRISIQEQDFSGTAIELEGQPSPFLLTYETSGDFIYEPIRPSSAEINLTLGTSNGVEMEDIWTADERKFKVVHTIDSDVDWIGWIIPDGFEHEFRGGVYYVTLMASDVLTTLEKVPFVYDDGNTYGRQDLTYNNGAEFPFSLVATEILRKLDLDINTWIADDVWEVTMNAGDNWNNNNRNCDPWSLSYVNVRTYINDSDRKNIPYWQNADEAWNCKDVMENILRLHGCILYQEKGTWRILRQNIRENYNPGGAGFIRQWVKYNTLCVFVGKEPVEDEEIIQSNSLSSAMIGDDHLMRMDQVFAAYRINYEFQFTRTGDNTRNIIKNPSFVGTGFQTPSQGIDSWVRFRFPSNKWYPRARTTAATPGVAGSWNLPPVGVNRCLEMGVNNPGVSNNQMSSNANIWVGVAQNPNPTLNKGDKVRLSMWVKFRPTSPSGHVRYYGMLKIMLFVPGEGVQYYLVNKPTLGSQGIINAIQSEWLRETVPNISGSDRWFFRIWPENPDSRQYNWWKITVNVDDIPDSGQLEFKIHGLAATRGPSSSNNPAFVVKPLTQGADDPTKLPSVQGGWVDEGGDIPRFQITDIRFEIIEPNTEDFVKELDYIYNNPNPTYTYNPPPVRIYNGDVDDVNHISKIIVPSRVAGKNFWVPVSVPNYQSASLGLITAQSIMNQYYRPNRILEGTIKASSTVGFSTRFGFVAAPGIRWILNRCTFNRKFNYIEDATFRQITTVPGEIGCPGSENPDEPEPEIPDGGGEEGGVGVDPNWQATGLIRCRKIDHVNTGEVEVQEQDVNPNSTTYGNTRWIIEGTDLQMCPIGEPSDYWWGADVQDYNTDNFIDTPFETISDSPKEVQIAFNNDGDKYLFFLHRAGLGFGLVERIYTTGQPGNIISDWQYLSDVVINGYTYRVLRTNYVLAEFSNFSFNFVFSE